MKLKAKWIWRKQKGYNVYNQTVVAKRSFRVAAVKEAVMAVTADELPDYANIGSQHNFLTNRKGCVKVDHLFAYENQPAFLAFLSERLRFQVVLKQKNVSPPIDAPLSEAALKVLKAARPEEFELYAQLMAAGGRLDFRV